ncbi:MAG: cation:proton antiporter [Ruminococcaceae bacterium]|nr:cation:proton antiporter [Oscillospiraceae bacterium]
MTDNTLLILGIILFSGLIFGRLAKLIKLPNVTGYLVAGLILGPYCLKIISENTASSFNIISEVALGFIAFSVGSEFKISYLKKVGITPLIIAITEAFGAIILVAAGLIAFGFDISFSIVLASIASATAPAATIMVVRQYKAKGPLTDTLLTVVALDDAVALMGFGIAVAAANAINGVSESLVMTLITPLAEIFGALVIGAILGILFNIPLRFFKKDGNRLVAIYGFIFIGVAISQLVNVSSLLLLMSTGFVLVNMNRESASVMKITDYVTPPIFLMFFVVSGAELNLSVLSQIGLVGVLYIVLRVVGKMLGAAFGGMIMKAPKTVVKYLGPTLVPQAGVAIGLSLIATTVVPEYGQTIRAVILCATFIYELVGPLLAKVSLKAAGEINS